MSLRHFIGILYPDKKQKKNPYLPTLFFFYSHVTRNRQKNCWPYHKRADDGGGQLACSRTGVALSAVLVAGVSCAVVFCHNNLPSCVKIRTDKTLFFIIYNFVYVRE